jgi:hypothetical protein
MSELRPQTNSDVTSYNLKISQDTFGEVADVEEINGISCRRHEVVVDIDHNGEKKKAIIILSQLTPTELQNKIKEKEQHQPPVTLIIYGGGASPASGTNLKIGEEIQKQLIKQIDNGAIVPNITNILSVSHLSGAIRDEGLDNEQNLSLSARAGREAIRKLKEHDQDIQIEENKIFMGFSMGSGLALESALLAEEEKTQMGDKDRRTDAICLETAGIFDQNSQKMLYHFMISNFIGAFRSYWQEKKHGSDKKRTIRESMRLAKEALSSTIHEVNTSWVIHDRMATIGLIIKDMLAPQSWYKDLKSLDQIKKPAKIRPDTAIANSNNWQDHLAWIDNSREDMDRSRKLKGHILFLQVIGAKVFPHVNQKILQSGMFPNALRSFVDITGGSHSRVMVDDIYEGTMMSEVAKFLCFIEQDYQALDANQEKAVA